MRRSLKFLAIPLSSIISGFLLYLSAPPANLSYVIWVSLVPVFVSMSFGGYFQAFFISLLTGAVFGGLIGSWFSDIPAIPFISSAMIVLYFALFFGVFGIFFRFVEKRTYFPKVVVAPCLWVSIEYLRSNLSFLALPWALLGHSLYDAIPIIQVSSITSVYGVSFLIVFFNAAVAEIVVWIIRRRTGTMIFKPSPVVAIYSLASAIILVFAAYIWGINQIQAIEKSRSRDLLKATLIQGNFTQEEIQDIKLRKKIMDRYQELTLQASGERPDIVIWPETSVPDRLGVKPETDNTIKEIAQEMGTPILLGSSLYAKIERKGRKLRKDRNTAFLIDSNGEIISSYHKIKLVPFWEYLPLEGRFTWPKWLVPSHGITIPGDDYKVFSIPKGRFGVVMCWENCFSDLFRQFVRNGAQFMVNLTNEAVFGRSVVPTQLLQMGVFRAVENRVALLRCANTGISAFIDHSGKIRTKVVDSNGNDVMVSGILTVSVPDSAGPTFYTRYGDVFAIACSIGSFLFLIFALLPLRIRSYLKIKTNHE
jgi:apolipoprotein N-acyltransferase